MNKIARKFLLFLCTFDDDSEKSPILVKKKKFSWTNYRSMPQRCSIKKRVFKNFAKFTGKHLCQSLFFNNAGLRPATLLKIRLWHKCFPVKFAKFLRTTFIQNTSGRFLPKLTINNKAETQFLTHTKYGTVPPQNHQLWNLCATRLLYIFNKD